MLILILFRLNFRFGKGVKDEMFHKSSFLLRLFDRTVDLAPFSYNSISDDVPLYAVCRAWFKNNSDLPKLYESPQKSPIDRDSDLEGINEGKPPGIYHLPKPLERPKDKLGDEIDLRIPKSVREYERVASKVDEQINSLADESFTTLFNKNICHWKEVRQEWKAAAFENERRYKHSCDVLKAMYER